MQALVCRTEGNKSTFFVFVKNLFVLFCFRGIGILSNVLASVFSGRELSVADNGQLGLVISIGNVLVIPLVMGVNTWLLKVLPEQNEAERQETRETVWTVNVLLCLVISILCWISTPIVCRAIHISAKSWFLGIGLSVAMNACIISETFLKSEEKFFHIGIAKTIGGIVLLGATVVSIFLFHYAGLYLFIGFNILSQIMVFLCMLSPGKPCRIRISRRVLRSVYPPSILYMFSWFLSTSLYYLDFYVLSGMCSGDVVGIYNVYQVNVRNYFSIFYNDIFAAVLLPTILNRGIRREELQKQIKRFLLPAWGALVAGTACVVIILVKAYGQNYSLDFRYVLLVSLGIAFQGIYFFLNSLLVTDGVSGAKLSLKILSVPYVFLFGIIWILTKYFGLMGTFVSFVVNQGILMIIIWIRYCSTNRKNSMKGEGDWDESNCV